MTGIGGGVGAWRRFPRKGILAGALVCALASLATRGEGARIVSPHDTTKPRYCLNCHTEDVFTKNCDEPEGYCLLGGSVDGICLTCHLKEECCRVGLDHLPHLYIGLRNHPSDVDVRDIPRAFHPKTLPIHQGRITCRTCHLHLREKPEGYKMLRLVTITSQGIDWSILCKDCHKDR